MVRDQKKMINTKNIELYVFKTHKNYIFQMKNYDETLQMRRDYTQA